MPFPDPSGYDDERDWMSARVMVRYGTTAAPQKLLSPLTILLGTGVRLMTLTPDEIRAQKRAYYQKNREKILAKQRTPEARAKQKVARSKHASKPEVRARAREKARLWLRANPDYVRGKNDRAHKKRQAAQIIEAGRPRPDICDSCGEANGKINFDHCHQRGVFRGWLCDSCNVILGLANDNANYLRKLIAYLERTKSLISPQLVLPGV